MNNTKLTILLVDDDEIDIMNVRRALAKNELDANLYTANDGVEALELLRGGTVPAERRLILLDLNMPRMSGLEFLRELRADPALRANIVIVLTTSDEERDLVEAYHLNVAGYLLKPVSFAEFVALVGRLQDYWTVNQFPSPNEG